MTNQLTLAQTAEQLLAQNRGERILPFQFEGETYWLKQPEQLSGVEKLLKPRPKLAFRNEIESLQFFREKNAPVPELMLFSDDFLVLKDSGVSAGSTLENDKFSEPQRIQILNDCAKALANWHRMNFIHGRPAIRDMLWKEGNVTFIDFENHKERANLLYQKARDALIFVHSLCREETLSDEQVQKVTGVYQQHCEPAIWAEMQKMLARLRWLYYVLLPFKRWAHTDLIAIYRLFENMQKLADKPNH